HRVERRVDPECGEQGAVFETLEPGLEPPALLLSPITSILIGEHHSPPEKRRSGPGRGFFEARPHPRDWQAGTSRPALRCDATSPNTSGMRAFSGEKYGRDPES